MRKAWPLVLIGILAPRVYLILKYRSALIESDEAVVGLMARHILQGDLPIFYWGQHYLGTLEAFFTAALFAIFGASALVVKLSAFLLFSAFLVSHFFLAREAVSVRVAALATVPLAISPAFLTIWSLKLRGGYMALLLLGTLALLLAVKLMRHGYTRRRAFLLGLLLGLGWWTHFLSAVYLIPILCILLWKDEKRFFSTVALPFSGGFLLGGLPFWAYNLTHSWASLRVHGAQQTEVVLDFFHFLQPGLSILLGARPNWGTTDLFPYAGPLIISLAIICSATWLWKYFRNHTPPRFEGKHLLLFFALLFPFIFSASGFAWFVTEPRYLIPLYSVIYILMMAAFQRKAAQYALCALLVGLNLAGTFLVTHEEFTGYTNVESNEELLSFLRQNKINRVCAPYWTAYRLTFESEEDIICNPPEGDVQRNTTYAALVHSSPNRAFVRLRTPRYQGFQSEIKPPLNYIPVPIGSYEVFLPHSRD